MVCSPGIATEVGLGTVSCSLLKQTTTSSQCGPPACTSHALPPCPPPPAKQQQIVFCWDVKEWSDEVVGLLCR